MHLFPRSKGAMQSMVIIASYLILKYQSCAIMNSDEYFVKSLRELDIIITVVIVSNTPKTFNY